MKTWDKIHSIEVLTPLALDTSGMISKEAREKAEKKISELIDSLDITPKKKGGENVTPS